MNKKLFFLVWFSFSGILLSGKTPPTELTVSPASPVVTESWSARIVFYVEPLTGRHADTCPLSSPSASPFDSFFGEQRTGIALQGFPVQGVRFHQAIDRVKRGDMRYWRITLTSDAIPASVPGAIAVGPLAVEATLFDGRFRRGFFGPEANTVRRRFVSNAATVTVCEPPAAGRPAGYLGAIGSNVTVHAALDANVCTAGDPLLFTLTVSGANDTARVHPPALKAALADTGYFRADEVSVKSHTDGSRRVFTWRVRALKAGTVEFPALSLAFYDTARRAYAPCRTEALPVQVKAGAQVALGLSDEAQEAEDVFPMPDGLDLDFPDAGNADFTFKRAVSTACHATTAADFARAAHAYEDYLAQRYGTFQTVWAALRPRPAAEARDLARHLANLGALRLLSGDARGAVRALTRAGDLVGDSPSLIRGLKASYARLRNDPRADLPLPRMMFPFWFRLTLLKRVAALAGAIALLFFGWYLAGRLGRRSVLIALVAVLFAEPAASQGFPRAFRNFSFGGGGAQRVKATLSLEPAEIVVGEPAAFVFAFDVENGVEVEQLQIGGMPDARDKTVEYGELKRLDDRPSPVKKGRQTRYVKLPVRFLAPFAGRLAPRISGMLVTRSGNGASFSFTSSVNFGTQAEPLEVSVNPLPEEGRPPDYSGAVGTALRLTVDLTPRRVHPGDLVTARYVLNCDGYFPTNVLPRITGLTAAFKTYELKEVRRTPTAVTWTQVLVPQTASATNALSAETSFYDIRAKRYAAVRAPDVALAFISETAVSTENTSVVIDGQAESASAAVGNARAQPVTLRFAPSETAPVVSLVPAGKPLETLQKRGAWHRVASPDAIGWMKK